MAVATASTDVNEHIRLTQKLTVAQSGQRISGCDESYGWIWESSRALEAAMLAAVDERSGGAAGSSGEGGGGEGGGGEGGKGGYGAGGGGEGGGGAGGGAAGSSGEGGSWSELRILELGSGTGWLALRLAQLGAHVTATDRSGPSVLLRRNVMRNQETFRAPGAAESALRVECHELSWEDTRADARAACLTCGGPCVLHRPAPGEVEVAVAGEAG